MKLLDIDCFKKYAANKVKLLRHSSEEDLWQMYHDNTFERYQNNQGWDVFSDAEYIFSFIAEQDHYAKFVGVWKVLSKSTVNNQIEYKTVEEPGFSDLSTRLIIDWGIGTRSWAQWLNEKGNKIVSEILPQGYIGSFPGYYDFILNYNELREMIFNHDANREWHKKLNDVSAIYSILNTKNGKIYIGSAYGKEGLLQRWTTYAKDFTGNNKFLMKEKKEDSNCYKYYRYSIIRVFESGITKKSVINHESLVKEKLGSRVYGLNDN